MFPAFGCAASYCALQIGAHCRLICDARQLKIELCDVITPSADAGGAFVWAFLLRVLLKRPKSAVKRLERESKAAETGTFSLSSGSLEFSLYFFLDFYEDFSLNARELQLSLNFSPKDSEKYRLKWGE